MLQSGDVAGFNKSRNENPNWEPDLSGADLSLKILTGVNLVKANLKKAKFVRSSLSGANLTDANLTITKGVTADQLSYALLRNVIATDDKTYNILMEAFKLQEESIRRW